MTKEEIFIEAKSLYETANADQRYVLETLFPELKESEDERVRKAIKSVVSYNVGNNKIYGVSKEDMLALLEKQGEQKPYSWKPTKEQFEALDYAYNSCSDTERGNYYEGVLESLIEDLHRFEKQGEQKPADKVEPKFHEGYWVVRGKTIAQILDVQEQYYVGLDIDGNDFTSSRFLNDDKIHLWTIQDAKDGDVLVASDGSIFLFKGTIGSACKHYVALTTDGAVKFNEGLEHFWETSRAVHPATKEQRELLFQNLCEAGYEWDSEKKELKKIEQNSAWSEEDNKKIEAIVDTLNRVDQSIMAHNWNMSHGEVFNWLKSIKDRVQLRQEWNEEDEDAIGMAIIALEDMYDEDAPNTTYGGYNLPFNKAAERLKSIKNRVQLKEEWSEEDKNYYDTIIAILENTKDDAQLSDSQISFLKSLRPQNTWKPSDEQITWLYRAADDANKDSRMKQVLNNLLSDLKKLREE